MKERRAYWPRPGDATEPAAETWPCGHPRTPANTQHIGKSGDRCRLCRRKITRDSNRRKRKENSHGGVESHS